MYIGPGYRINIPQGHPKNGTILLTLVAVMIGPVRPVRQLWLDGGWRSGLLGVLVGFATLPVITTPLQAAAIAAHTRATLQTKAVMIR